MPKAISSVYNVMPPARVDRNIGDVEAVARWLDYAFVLPGGFRFGVAGIIGLIPGIGDVIDALISLYIVGRAVQLGASKATLTRMTLNVGIEAVIGSIPFLGDLFDVAFKANRRNYRLLLNHIEEPRRQSGKDWMFVVAVGLALTAALALPIVGLIEVLHRL